MRLPNLLARFLTSVILIGLVFSGILFLSHDAFAFCSGMVMLVAAYEWTALAGITNRWKKLFYINDIAILMILGFFVPDMYIPMVLVAGFLGWVAGFFRCFKIAGVFLLPVCWKALNILCFMPPHPYKLIILFLIVWLADIVAYFVGCTMGKHKLAPTISPNKSIEGAVGALIVVGAIFGFIARSKVVVGLALVTVIAAIIGDLFESFMKRSAGVKDSGKILPGHGGLLDRIDSLIFAAPVFTLGLLVLHLGQVVPLPQFVVL